MATYAIGDIQGCFDSLAALLVQIGFDAQSDRVWLSGDLVNRGPKSLEVLRWARGLGDRAVAVLGNHDLHLLAAASGAVKARSKDTFGDVLSARDARGLIAWLRGLPLLVDDGDVAMVHAGLVPSWSVERAAALAVEAEAAIRGDDFPSFMSVYRSAAAPVWSNDLTGTDRAHSIANVLTRLRCCTDSDELDDYAGPPGGCPDGFAPWYAHKGRASADRLIVFGHWAAHGFYRGDNVVCLDSGCVWGHQLTALRLDDGEVFHQDAID